MKHFAVIIMYAPGEQTVYTALCGYESTEQKEFRTDGMGRVTCDKCKERRIHAVQPTDIQQI